jgi:nicotinate-nucleotide adenylyltransferase
MVEIACARTPEFVPSRIEEFDEVSYSIQTIQRVKATAGPDAVVEVLIGAAAVCALPTRHRGSAVGRAGSVILVSRPGHHYHAPPGSTVFRLETVALPVSSSALRERLAAGEQPAEIPAPVMEYIKANGLYGFPSPRRNRFVTGL